MRTALIEALTKAGIVYTDASIGGVQGIEVAEAFRKGEAGGSARVLVLNIDSADVIGW